MSFKEYVAKRRVTNTPMGDFVGDAKGDAGLQDVRTWPDLETHLHLRGACAGATEAGRAVWRGYCAAQRRAEKANV